MTASAMHDFHLPVPPGLEAALLAEVRELGLAKARVVPGGVAFSAQWTDAWRANYLLRGASRVLVQISSFPCVHLSQLDKTARKIDWAHWLPKGAACRFVAHCRKSRLYHAKAVAERVERAALDAIGGQLNGDTGLRIQIRVLNNICTISLDTSGELLHRRGFKQAVVKAPMRETMASLLLRACGFRGAEPVYDPMCGSGTFVIEAAEMAAGLAPGRGRSFAFEQLPSFDADAWSAIKADRKDRRPDFVFAGSDRDAGAITAARANADRAGVVEFVRFSQADVREARPPDGPAGLVMVNPPYGARIGNRKALYPVYHALGETLRTHFAGWRVGLITSDEALARATRLPFQKPGPVIDHSGIKIRLHRTAALSG
ncbi:THUMP domain-containing class I SAM-dependent RNA methyltransferase [Hyphobacterium sp.]|jgi:putative N6-adenine-specific DNA methylase|uniref:THUMP domain-containing class I SAM-dependent RNA methyltransferase n=1 Tax=Hyphobacterium sp. TaxID=2004662 RepID=UPI003BACED70